MSRRLERQIDLVLQAYPRHWHRDDLGELRSAILGSAVARGDRSLGWREATSALNNGMQVRGRGRAQSTRQTLSASAAEAMVWLVGLGAGAFVMQLVRHGRPDGYIRYLGPPLVAMFVVSMFSLQTTAALLAGYALLASWLLARQYLAPGGVAIGNVQGTLSALAIAVLVVVTIVIFTAAAVAALGHWRRAGLMLLPGVVALTIGFAQIRFARPAGAPMSVFVVKGSDGFGLTFWCSPILFSGACVFSVSLLVFRTVGTPSRALHGEGQVTVLQGPRTVGQTTLLWAVREQVGGR